DRQGAGGIGGRVVRIAQRGDNGIAADGGRRGCRSIVGNRDTGQSGRCGRGRDGVRGSVVTLRQVARRECRRRFIDRQGAGGIGGRVVRIGQRSHNGVATGVGGSGGRSVVRDGNTQTRRIRGDCGGLGRSVIGLRQIAERDGRCSIVDDQCAR